MSPVLIIELVGGAILLALCGATAWLVLRVSSRARIRRWPGVSLLIGVVAAALPWAYVIVRVHHFSIDVNTVPQLIGLIVALLLAIIVFLLFPLAVVLSAAVWLLARRAPLTSE